MKHMKRNKSGIIRQVRISHIAARELDKCLEGIAELNGSRTYPRQFVSEAILEKIQRVIQLRP